MNKPEMLRSITLTSGLPVKQTDMNNIVESLSSYISNWTNGDPLDGDEVKELCLLIAEKLNENQGNI